jgi:CHASE2 domain-containing sensor protein
MGITALVVVMRLFGFLEASELWFFDRMMQFQPIEEQDERLLVVEVMKEDIDKQKGSRQGSLTDETLLNLLKKLLNNQPRAIGLDIYRDFQTQTLKISNLLKSDSRIFAVCNVGESNPNNPDAYYGVKPPPEISAERLGFSDFISDSESIVRRQVLKLDTDPKSLCWSSDKKAVNNSFSLELAKHYLTNKNKKYEPQLKNDLHLQIDDVVLEPLRG